jgi:TRAP-type C4-dicarboxylate transport system permease small subunit
MLMLMLSALVVVITLQVVFRVWFTALSWSEELSRFLLIYLSTLGAAIAYRKGSHISITLYHDKLPGPARAVVELLVTLGSVAFFILMIQYSTELIAKQRYQVSAAMQLPMQLIYFCMPLSMAAMLIFSIEKIIRIIGGFMKGAS